MNDINLLARDKKPSKVVSKGASKLVKVSVVLFILLIASIAVMVSVYFVFDNRVKALTNDNSNLKVQITALEETEQKYFFIKNRLENISKVKESDQLYDKIIMFENAYSLATAPNIVTSAELDEKRALVTTSTDSSLSMTKYLSSAMASGKFSTIVLDSFSFTKKTGYVVKLEFSM